MSERWVISLYSKRSFAVPAAFPPPSIEVDGDGDTLDETPTDGGKQYSE